MSPPTGLRRRTDAAQRRLSAARPYSGDVLPLRTVMQPIAYLHDQRDKPTCVGQAITAGIEPHVGVRLSAVDLATDARRRQGDLGNPLVGTDSEHGIESAILRGLSPYVPGEDQRDPAEDMQIATLSQELQADARRIKPTVVHRTIRAGDSRAPLVDGLQRGYACMFGDGTKPPYEAVGINCVADESYLGGNDGGHEQRIFAYWAPDDLSVPAEWRDCFGVLNSWPFWGGLILPGAVTLTDGTVLAQRAALAQCVLVPARVIDLAWERDALEVLFA